jgi:SAM-dependent methyltransferase
MGLSGLATRVRRSIGPRIAPARSSLNRLRARGRTPTEQWQRGLASESRFWRRYLRNELRAGREGHVRIDPDATFDGHPIYGRVLAELASSIRILDVGAGPLTLLPKRMSGKRLEIVAVDPLADDYDRLLADAGIVPLVRTRKAEGERLVEHFSPRAFDLVHAANSVDHAYDPVRVIAEMLAVCRLEGRVLLRHLRNEALRHRYRGLHQWNFEVRGDELWIWNDTVARNVTGELSGSIAARDVRLVGSEVVAVLQPAPG